MWWGLGAIKTLVLKAVPEILGQTRHFFPRTSPTPSSLRAELNSCACGEHKGEFRFLKGPSVLNKQLGQARSFLVVGEHKVRRLCSPGPGLSRPCIKSNRSGQPKGQPGPESSQPAQEWGD